MICITKPQNHPLPPTYAVLLTIDELRNHQIADFLSEHPGEFKDLFEVVEGTERTQRNNVLLRAYVVDEHNCLYGQLGEIAKDLGFDYNYLTIPQEWLPTDRGLHTPGTPIVDRLIKLIHHDPVTIQELANYLAIETSMTLENEHFPSRNHKEY